MPLIPDGRTVLTSPDDEHSPDPAGARRHLPPFIPDTNPIEALNRQLRKAVKTKGHFPTEDAARKLIYLAIQNVGHQRLRRRPVARIPRATRRLLMWLVAEVVGQLDLHRALHQPLGQLRQQPTRPNDLVLGPGPASSSSTSSSGSLRGISSDT